MHIGIVGFGVVGKSALSFLTGEQGAQYLSSLVPGGDHKKVTLRVWDERELSEQEIEMIKKLGAQICQQPEVSLDSFIETNDFLVVSPGFNLNKYKYAEAKFICELDLFNKFFKKPVVAITGSLGKTTITKLIGKLANMVSYRRPLSDTPTAFRSLAGRSAVNVAIGGNVGIGMLDLLGRSDSVDLAVLELSSFQLEFNDHWAPDIAVWTNCFANHLDRHETMEAYAEAKLNLLKAQNEHQAAVLSASLLEGEVGPILMPKLADVAPRLFITSAAPVSEALLAKVPVSDFWVVYRRDNFLYAGYIFKGRQVETRGLFDLSSVPFITFIENWIQALVTLWLMDADLDVVAQVIRGQQGEFVLENEHRCEHVATINGADFYNDSKATVIQSTEAAVKRLIDNGRPVILILGGLGKGVDRSPLAHTLAGLKEVRKVYCFGSECAAFKNVSACLPTLEDVMADLITEVRPGDQVLFSPSGTSFDFYKNFEHRGQVFKDLVRRMAV